MNKEKLKISVGIVLGITVGLFGLYCLILPDTASTVLSVLLGIGILLTAVLAVTEAFSARKFTNHWWIFFIEAAVHLGLGLFLLFLPYSDALLANIMAVWTIVLGLFRLVRGVVRSTSELRILFIGLGISAAGVLIFSFPDAVQAELIYIVGALLLIAAVATVWTEAVKSRKLRTDGSSDDASSGDASGPDAPQEDPQTEDGQDAE